MPCEVVIKCAAKLAFPDWSNVPFETELASHVELSVCANGLELPEKRCDLGSLANTFEGTEANSLEFEIDEA